MEALKEKMTNLYYYNLEAQAKKNKININIPYINTPYIDTNTPHIVANTVMTETENINLSETETNYSEDFVYKKPWNKLNSVHKKIKMTDI